MFDMDDESPRSEHLAWCKDRALEYVRAGQHTQAWASFMSDMGKHTKTADHPGLMLGMMLSTTGSLNTAAAMEDFIKGFN